MDPTCVAECDQAVCRDVSDDLDGTLFQCCPVDAGTPEFPHWVNPFTLAVIFSGLYLVFKRRKIFSVKKSKEKK